MESGHGNHPRAGSEACGTALRVVDHLVTLNLALKGHADESKNLSMESSRTILDGNTSYEENSTITWIIFECRNFKFRNITPRESHAE